MACIGGMGGNYSPRTIGKVPEGRAKSGTRWTASARPAPTMLLGNWKNNLWVGNEPAACSGAADSDQGWAPDDRTPAHSLVREGQAVVIRNNLIGLPPGAKPFVLDAPRTVQLAVQRHSFPQFRPGLAA